MERTRAAISLLTVLTAIASTMGIAPPSGARIPLELDPSPASDGVPARGAALPVVFEPNLGQSDPESAFVARAGGYAFLLAPREAIYVLPSPARDPGAPSPASEPAPRVVRMKFLGGDPAPAITGLDGLPGRSNYYGGDDPSRWVPGVPHFERVRAAEVWPGVDVLFYGTLERDVRHDLVVRPGADLARIRLGFEGAEPFVDRDGSLLLREGGETLLRVPAPYTYQPSRGHEAEVPSGFVLHADGSVGFRVGEHDPREVLVIDPVTTAYSTYLGGSGTDSATSLAFDGDGNAYVTGSTTSANFPILHALQAAYKQNGDVFVAKFGPAGNLLYSTFLGGTASEYPGAIAVDAAGSAHVTGHTTSYDFPRLHAFQASNQGNGDVFVAGLTPSGALAYSTYLGGSATGAPGAPGNDHGYGIAVDAAGNAYVTGQTYSTNFPTLGGLQSSFQGGGDAFVAKFSPVGGLVYSTFLGGANTDRASSIAVDASGNAYVTGSTHSTNFPVLNAFQPAKSSSEDVFVTKLAPQGNALVFSTYLGGSSTQSDTALGIAVDSAGSAHVTGYTQSSNFPTLNAFQPTYSGRLQDAFVTKFTPDGKSLVYSTFLGSTGQDYGYGIAVDGAGNAHVTGWTGYGSPVAFPLVNAFQTIPGGGGADAFVAKLSPSGSVLYSSYLGGTGRETGRSIAVDAGGNPFVAGETSSSNFPVLNAHQPVLAGDRDAFVARIPPCGPPETKVSLAGTSGNAGWWRSAVRVDFTWTGACSALATYASLNGGPIVAGSSITVLEDGFHTLRYYSVDVAGNAESAKSLEIRIDTTPPSTRGIPSGLAGTNGWWRSDVDVTLSATDTTSGVFSTSHRLDGGALRSGTTLVVTGDGTHSVEHHSEDVAGNVEAPRSLEIRIDTTPPDVLILKPTTGHAYVEDRIVPLPFLLPATVAAGDLTIETHATDATSGVDRVEVFIDGRLRATLRDLLSFLWEASEEALGEHAIFAVAYDGAGNSLLTATTIRTIPTAQEGVAATADDLAAP